MRRTLLVALLVLHPIATIAADGEFRAYVDENRNGVDDGIENVIYQAYPGDGLRAVRNYLLRSENAETRLLSLGRSSATPAETLVGIYIEQREYKSCAMQILADSNPKNVSLEEVKAQAGHLKHFTIAIAQTKGSIAGWTEAFGASVARVMQAGEALERQSAKGPMKC